MGTLYELQQEYEHLYDLLAQGEIDDGIFNDTLDALLFDERFEEKAESYGKIIRMLEADAAAAETEQNRLAGRRAAFTINAKRVKERLYEAMKATGREKVKTPLFTFGIQVNPERVVVDDIRKLLDRDELWKVHEKCESELNKAYIKELLKAGVAIPGARLEQSDSLRIR